MNQPIVRSNPVALLDAVLSRGLSVTNAAKTASVDRGTLDEAIRSSRPLTVKTAAKLKAAFGDDVVTLVNPKRRELEQLEALREEFADRYPDDSARLDALDAMIRDARAELEGGNHDVHCS